MTSNNNPTRESVHRPSRTGLSTDSPPFMCFSRDESAGTTVSLMYCCFVLPNSKEGRSMEPRQLRLPGFTRFWGLEIPRVRIRELQPLRPVRQRVFVAVGAIEQ